MDIVTCGTKKSKKKKQGVCVNKFSVKPSSQYSCSFMSESEECRVKSEKCRAWARREAAQPAARQMYESMTPTM